MQSHMTSHIMPPLIVLSWNTALVETVNVHLYAVIAIVHVRISNTYLWEQSFAFIFLKFKYCNPIVVYILRFGTLELCLDMSRFLYCEAIMSCPLLFCTY